MNSDASLQILLRALPAILVFVLGFLAANDNKTRRQWSQFLYSVGSLRADQRDDAQKQSSVKWPFFIVSLLMLWWPLSYYRHATRKIEIGDSSDLIKQKPAATPAPTATPKPAPTGPTPPPAPPRPGETAAPDNTQNSSPGTPAATKTPASNSGPRL